MPITVCLTRCTTELWDLEMLLCGVCRCYCVMFVDVSVWDLQMLGFVDCYFKVQEMYIWMTPPEYFVMLDELCTPELYIWSNMGSLWAYSFYSVALIILINSIGFLSPIHCLWEMWRLAQMNFLISQTMGTKVLIKPQWLSHQTVSPMTIFFQLLYCSISYHAIF